MMEPDSFHSWLAGRIQQMLGRSSRHLPLIFWCDPQREWRQLLALTAADAGLEFWSDEAHELLLRERLRCSAQQPRVVWLPVGRQAITFLEVYALQAEVEELRLSRALAEYGVDLPVDDARNLEPLLASYVEERFDHPKAAWKDLTLGHAETTLVSADDILTYLAATERDLGQLESEGKFALFARIASRDFGLPSPTAGSEGQWRVQALARLLCTEAAERNPQRPPAEGERIIPDGPARQNALKLLKDWRSNVDWIDTFEALVPQADRTTSLRYWAKGGAVTSEPLVSQIVEEVLFNEEAERIAAIVEFEPLARALTNSCGDYQRHAEGFWGRLASHRVPWQELAGLAANAVVLQNVEKTAAEWQSPAEAVAWYTQEGWKADAAGEELFREAPDIPGTLVGVRARLQRAFMRLLESVNRVFSEAVARRGLDLGLPFAGELLAEPVEGASIRNPVVVLILDAFRYELGRRLSALVNLSEPATRAEVAAARAPLPSITDLGMAFCLPGAADRLSTDVESDAWVVKAEGFPGNLANAAQRREWLRQRFKLKERAVLSVDEVLTPGEEPLSVKNLGRLVFVFGDEVDSDGHEGRLKLTGSGYNLARYAQVVRKLRSAGYPTILITTDHGFFHWKPESDQVDQKPEGERLWPSRRAVVGRGLHGGGSLRLPVSGSDLDCMVPRGINTFQTYGGTGYYHGGATLQEIVIPVVTVSWPRKSKKIGAVLKPVDRIERLQQKVEVGPASVQQSLVGGVDENMVSRSVLVKVIDPATQKTLFRSDVAALEPAGGTVALTLKKVDGAEARRGAELQLQLLDADDDELLGSTAVRLALDMDEWD